MKKTHATFNWYHCNSMRRTNGQYSIQQPGALLEQLFIVYLKKIMKLELKLYCKQKTVKVMSVLHNFFSTKYFLLSVFKNL